MLEPKARIIDDKKFMWDGRSYESRAEAEGAKKAYEEESFETHIVEEDDGIHVYTRRLASADEIDAPSAV